MTLQWASLCVDIEGGKASTGRPAVLCPPVLCQWGLNAGWRDAGRASAVRVVKNLCGDWNGRGCPSGNDGVACGGLERFSKLSWVLGG